MRNAPICQAERHRISGPGYESDSSDGNNGAFEFEISRSPRLCLRVICSDGYGWDHVSVSLPTRCPSWEEMCRIKEIFFRDDEWVMQLHPPKSQNIYNHPYCLHLWRPQNAGIPLPHAWMVGFPDLEPKGEART